MEPERFEELAHTADWTLRVRGATLDELFENAARGMQSLAGAQPAPTPGRWARLKLEAPDPEGLLVAWLEELLFRIEARQVYLADPEVRTREGRRLRARVRELPLAALARQIKAVTYHDLAVVRTQHGLEATLTFDV